MSIFSHYAKYYDLLYQQKNYTQEMNFVLDVFSKHMPHITSLLDLGCGSGKHLFVAAEKGIKTVGIDVSPTMLEMAQAQREIFNANHPCLQAPDFYAGDIRSLRLDEQFDCIVSLFHVMSYQTTERDFLETLRTAWHHLRKGGYFLFDFWHGPGVLCDLPTSREKHFEDAHTKISRISMPHVRIEDNVVEVLFDINVTDKTSGNENSFQEKHEMRYWFLPEVRHLASTIGFCPCTAYAWMQHNLPSCKDWYACILLQKV